MGFFSWLFGRSASGGCVKPFSDDRALLTAIIDYKTAPLYGCINDAMNWKAKLLSVGFKESNIHMLLNSDATRANIISESKWLVATSGRKFNLFSGHGSQWPDSAESDGMAEIICPYDFEWDREKMITDDDYAELFRDVCGTFTWVSDSCHSGDLTRAIGRTNPHYRRAKFIPPPAELLAKLAGRRRKVKNLKFFKSQMNVAFIGGCQPNQTSADTFYNGQYCGALSAYLLETMGKFPSSEKVKNLVEETTKLLRRDGYDQIPYPDGSQISKPFLTA